MTEEINKGCEFQSDCIEYKDISYLKIMPICAIHELSIACHDKVNKCKYYKLYKQLKRLEQEQDKLKSELHSKVEFIQEQRTIINEYSKEIEIYKQCQGKRASKREKELEQENKELKEWKERVVKLFESACRCKYLNEETDICSYTNEKCININKCVYKYQELSSNYRSALEEIKTILDKECGIISNAKVVGIINEVLNESN